MKLEYPIRLPLFGKLSKEAVLHVLSNLIDSYEAGERDETSWSCNLLSIKLGYTIREYYKSLIISDGISMSINLGSSKTNTAPFNTVVYDYIKSELVRGIEAHNVLETNRIIALNILYIAISEDWEI